ncbi:hypothetical protein D910_08157, partial [Dendroctonus ponderosae]
LRYGTNFEEGIVRVFQEDTTISVRVAARRFVMSQWKARATLNKEKLHPYHYTPVQDLLEEDPLRRIGFCRFMLNADMEDSTFLSRILWTDESNFNREGITNYHNAHYYRSTLMYDERFPNRWMGRGGPISWLARSPDLTPLDIHVWGRIKELVSAGEIHTREELIQRITDAAITFKNTFLARVTRTEIRRR